jgi:hypothetical protein
MLDGPIGAFGSKHSLVHMKIRETCAGDPKAVDVAPAEGVIGPFIEATTTQSQ